MPLVFTEIAINAAGEMAVEIHNNGGTTINLANTEITVNPTGSAILDSIHLFSLTSIPPGGTFVIAHPNIGGDLTSFTLTNPAGGFSSIGMITNLTFPVDDYLGNYQDPVSVTSNDTVFLTTDPNAQLGPSSPAGTPGFSNNTLGVACFLAGTMIATPNGERAVQELQAGDLVLTADGRAVPVLWLGEQLVKKRIGQVPEALEPVCIKAGMLGNHSDLYVTADHGMIVDGMVVNAGALVNGESVTWVNYAAPYTVYHIETDAHEVLLANGAQAESFLDVVTRARFDNARKDGLNARKDGLRIIPEMPLPRVSSARLLPETLKHRDRNAGIDLQICA